MFSYNMPVLKFNIDKKKLSVLFMALYVLSLVPMLILGFYDWPSADDYTMALQPHLYFVENGGFLGTVWASLQKSWFVYSQYEGYFFSIILTCICPSVFGEAWYAMTPFLILGMLTFGVCYFFDALFVKAWKLDKDLSRIGAMITLILMIHCLEEGPTRAEAFYWYSGAINYTFTFGMAFFWLGLVIRTVYDADAKARKRKLFWAAFWGFWMGGANYLSALELAICSVLILVICFMVKAGRFRLEGVSEDQKKSFGFIWIPAVMNLIGFAFSCFSPGNATRSEEVEAHFGAVKSVFLSLFSTLNVMTNDMMRWEVLVALLLLVPVFRTMAADLKQKLQHPVMFALFAYLLVSSNVTPPYYAVGNMVAGRLRALAWMEFVFMLVLTVFYFTSWARQHLEGKLGAQEAEKSVSGMAKPGEDSGAGVAKDKFSETASMLIVMCLAFLIVGSVLCVIPDEHYYCATSAAYDLVSGTAAGYKAENLARLELLKDESLSDVALKSYENRPEMLIYIDITPDESDWLNMAVATYYGKNTVVLEKR